MIAPKPAIMERNKKVHNNIKPNNYNNIKPAPCSVLVNVISVHVLNIICTPDPVFWLVRTTTLTPHHKRC